MNLRKTAVLGILGLLFASGTKAQTGGVRFRVADRATREAVIGAVAELRSRTASLATPLSTASPAMKNRYMLWSRHSGNSGHWCFDHRSSRSRCSPRMRTRSVPTTSTAANW